MSVAKILFWVPLATSVTFFTLQRPTGVSLCALISLTLDCSSVLRRSSFFNRKTCPFFQKWREEEWLILWVELFFKMCIILAICWLVCRTDFLEAPESSAAGGWVAGMSSGVPLASRGWVAVTSTSMQLRCCLAFVKSCYWCDQVGLILSFVVGMLFLFAPFWKRGN